MVSPSTAVAAAESNNVLSDNLAVLALGAAAGALSLAMLVLILARKRRHSAHPAFLAEAHDFPQVVNCASSL